MAHKTATCRICKQTKRRSSFAPSELTCNKTRGRCRECNRLRRMKYRDAAIARLRQWETDHPNETKERRRLWKLAYPERVEAIRKKRIAALKKNGGKHTQTEWLALVAAYGNRCLGCGKEFTAECAATKDHVIPVTRGGGDGIDNLQPLCALCNSTKGNRAYDYRYDFERSAK